MGEKNLTSNGAPAPDVNQNAPFQPRSSESRQRIPILFVAAYKENEWRVRIRQRRISTLASLLVAA